MVTTPQKVATGDVRRGVKMFERVNTRVTGIVENMCGFRIPGTGEVVDLFGTRAAGEDLAPRAVGARFWAGSRWTWRCGKPVMVAGPRCCPPRSRTRDARSRSIGDELLATPSKGYRRGDRGIRPPRDPPRKAAPATPLSSQRRSSAEEHAAATARPTPTA